LRFGGYIIAQVTRLCLVEPVRTDVRERDQTEAVGIDAVLAAMEVAPRRGFRADNW